MGAPVDIAGQRFGRLVAVRVAQSKPRKWLCRCDCGNDTVVLTRDLRNGNTTSCGCRKKDYEDLTGERFGKLVAEEYAGNSNGYSMWLCGCDCGRKVTVRSVSLKDGNTRSCGCLSSEVERMPSDAVDGTKLGNLGGTPTCQNTSGVRGVSWNRQKGKWEAYIKFQGKKRRLGLFDDIAAAAEARREAEQELFDPVLEAHGLEPTSEAEYEEALLKAVDNEITN